MVMLQLLPGPSNTTTAPGFGRRKAEPKSLLLGSIVNPSTTEPERRVGAASSFVLQQQVRCPGG